MDLFDQQEPLSVALPDGDLKLFRNALTDFDQRELLQELITACDWQAHEITLWGKKYPQPRLVAWHADSDCHYRYSGITLQAVPWTDTLRALKSRTEELAAHSFNSVLINYYRDQRDSMGLHSDDEPELGPQPVIASLSLGEQRTLLFKHKSRGDLGTIKLPLTSGSLLIMAGNTQHHWKHGIAKESQPCGPRVNLTFRYIQRG